MTTAKQQAAIEAEVVEAQRLMRVAISNEARATSSMTRLDFAKLALREGWITAAEAKAWVPGNALPQIVTDIIAQHIDGADKQDIAEINALGQLVVNRNDLLLRLLMAVKKLTDAQMDAHFGIAG